MRNFGPEKATNAREDRLYQNPINEIAVFLVRWGRNKVGQKAQFKATWHDPNVTQVERGTERGDTAEKQVTRMVRADGR